jgi:hypothetical protein
MPRLRAQACPDPHHFRRSAPDLLRRCSLVDGLAKARTRSPRMPGSAERLTTKLPRASHHNAGQIADDLSPHSSGPPCDWLVIRPHWALRPTAQPEAPAHQLTSCRPRRRSRPPGQPLTDVHAGHAPNGWMILPSECPSHAAAHRFTVRKVPLTWVELSGLEPLTSCMPVSLGMSVPGLPAATGQGWCLVAPGDSLHARPPCGVSC